MTREELNKDIRAKVSHESNKEDTRRFIKTFVKLFVIVAIVGTLFYTYTTFISTTKVGVREYRIINEKIPVNFNGLKIIQMSDLHYGSTMFNEDVKKIVNLINERKPDIVLFTGDLVNKNYKLESKEQEELIKNLKNISSSIGKYAVFGDEDNESIATILNQSDFTILRDEADIIYNSTTNPILLVGINARSKEPNIDKAYSYFKEPTHDSNIYTITISHEPDIVDDIVDTYNADLFLAGHSHNGNVRVPFTKYSLFKVNGAKKYDQDYYKLDRTELYISSGLGTKSGFRLFCRPSINFFRLSNK